MSADDLFHPAAPRLYTIPPAAGFVDALARGLARAFPEPEALAGVTVLLPTRRAGRALGEAFTRIEGGAGAALLPMIRPIGDVDADEPPFEPGELVDIAPEAVSPARRRFELARLILQREGAAGRSMGPGGALSLADDLARLIDDLATEEVEDLSALTQDIRATLPAHMEEAALFLDIVLEAWPARLAELGRADPAQRRSALLRALAERWRENPPSGPVIAAGSTGSIPAAAALLGVVARLPQGCVVLPGLDVEMDAEGWAAIDESHPQRAMKSLIDQLGVERRAVRWWPGAEESGREAPRTRLLAEALRPAEATSDWLSRVDTLKQGWGEDVFAVALSGLSVIEAPSPAEEARAAALALRETLETPGARAVLVTPDRALARRVSVEMDRFGVTLDDSAGQPLSDTAPGGFLMRILQAAGDPGSALGFIALAASPLFALGETRARLKPDLGALERAGLRGRRPGTSFEALYEVVTEAAGRDDRAAARWGELIRRTAAAFAPLLELGAAAPAKAWAQGLARTAERLAADETGAGDARVWAGDAGEAAADLITAFLSEAEALPELSLADFTAAFLEMARTRMVRPRYGAHPRLQILGPLEARLVSADRVVLSGLNEGVWPTGGQTDPFLSRGMRLAAGLAAPERRFGLAAHDFAQLAAGADVLLTRAVKQEGAPTVASRWLWRLQTLARGALGEDAAETALSAKLDYLALARALDDPGSAVSRITEPMPAPPVEARPRKLSVTRIETLVRDPYAIFAEKILNLEPLDPPDGEPGPRERGEAYHSALETWLQTLPDAAGLPHAATERLIAYGAQALLDAGFSEDRLGLELPRFARAAKFLVEWEGERRRDEAARFKTVVVETRGALTIEAPSGPFTLTAKADRIDLRPDGALDIIDYKTGAPPGLNEVKAGFAPQLPLEAAMAARGGFPGCPSHEPGDLIYLRLSGGKIAGEEKRLIKAPGSDEAVELAEDALDKLSALIAWFDDETRPYRSQPRVKFVNRYGAFDHLARRKEWASAPGDDAAGEG